MLTCGVDSLRLPENLPELLAPAPAYVETQPVIGLWPASASAALDAILEGDGRHSMLQFATSIGARAVKIAGNPANINTPADLADLEKRRGL